MGIAHLEKSERFNQDNNYVQALRYAELALIKLKLLKDRPFETLDKAFSYKTSALRRLGRHAEAMENAKERYSMWAMTNIRHPSSIWAAFDLIECCIHLNEYADAEMFARTAYEIINETTDNIISPNQRQEILAKGAVYLANATLALSHAGGIAPEAKQAAGVKAIALAREALEITTQLFGARSVDAATNMVVLAQALDHFNDVDDDEIIRLYAQANSIFIRIEGSTSSNVAVNENNFADAYRKRARRAYNADDLDRELVNLELALPHYLEELRILKANNDVASVAESRHNVTFIEEKILQVRAFIAEKAAAAASSNH